MSGGAPGREQRLQLGAGVDGDDARQRPRLVDVDARDEGVRDRAAHEHGVQHAGELDVVDVGARAGEDATVLGAGDARTDEPLRGNDVGHRVASFVTPAAASTPLTIVS